MKGLQKDDRIYRGTPCKCVDLTTLLWVIFRYLPVSQENERIAVYIRGAQCVNRAVDGDIVAFELLPEGEWFSQDGMPGEPAKEEVGTCVA